MCSDKVCRRISQPSAVGTAGLCSRMVRHRTRLEHHHVSAASECHLHRTGHVANQQPGLKPSRLCHSVGGGCRSACTMIESLRTWKRSCGNGAHRHRGSLMAVSTSGGVVCRTGEWWTYWTHVQLAVDIIVVCCIRYNRWTICKSLTYDFLKLTVCGSGADRMWRHLAC